jgi:hypothetical protein
MVFHDRLDHFDYSTFFDQLLYYSTFTDTLSNCVSATTVHLRL